MIAFGAMADAPQGYYTSCEGKSGQQLLKALHSKISSHTNVGYDGLWNVYKTSDVRPNGKVWDMYSTKEWTVGAQHCGNYKNVGDCINREHSVPQSWFSERSPMKSDAFHVYPTDGKVNGQRSNYPYGECSGGTTLPSNNGVKALGRLGSCTSPGYSGRVFEPVDEYKGDFARSYFYMVACYNDKIASWGGDAFAGNSYPGLKQWQLDVLLKWHRQDPVSDKERTRNDAVYAHQRNRNPFIDYPDLAEHVWGNAKESPWSANGTPKEVLSTPINGSVIDFGTCGTGVERFMEISVKGQNLTSAVSVSLSGAGFSTSATSLAASDVCSSAGATLTVLFKSSAVTNATGSLTLKSGAASSTVSLKAHTVDGLPALPARNVSETSFDACWVCIDQDGVGYTLDVRTADISIPGYPRTVDAASESFTVNGLVPGTTYAYTLQSPSGIKSNTVSVTTALPMPSIQFLFDGDELYFNSTPGTPSETAEILIDTENIDAPITLSVAEPFELSSDKATWTTSITLDPEQERFYLRLNSQIAGQFSSSLKATAGDYIYDDVMIQGITTSQPTFIETFEEPSTLTSYNGGIYDGSACQWKLVASLIGNDVRDHHSGSHGFRTSKTENIESYLEMTEPKEHGMGTVSFYARAWSDTEGGVLDLEVSTDGGLTWNKVKSFDVKDTGWTQFSAPVNVQGMARMRLSRASGKRICVDDIEASDYVMSALEELDYHSWDARSIDGCLVIDNYLDTPLEATVHSPSGALWHQGTVVSGGISLPLPAGVYLVTIDGFCRKVVVR